MTINKNQNFIKGITGVLLFLLLMLYAFLGFNSNDNIKNEQPLTEDLERKIISEVDSNRIENLIHQTDVLEIRQITNDVYIHTSFLETKTFGRVPCNGVFLVDQARAIVLDTPSDDLASNELIDFIETKLKADIEAIVVTHFHVDCLGGLNAFHEKKIPSYAKDITLELAEKSNATVPLFGFNNILELSAGSKKVICRFVGEGHTLDNTVCYIPDEKVLFGGCLIKSLGSGKGNLEDANEKEWSTSVSRILDLFPDIDIVVPGHGKHGGTELLDYTIDKFKE